VKAGPSAQCGAMANTTHFTDYDGNGNVTALLNAATGTESARYEYGPFGEPIRLTGPLAKLNPIQFSTQYADDVTGATKYLFRDLADGRWPSRDPVGERGGVNLYNFVGDCPQNRTDRFGLSDEEHFNWTDWPLEKKHGTPTLGGETWSTYGGGEEMQRLKVKSALSAIDCCSKVHVFSEWGAKGWYDPVDPQNQPHEQHHYDLIHSAYNHFITTVKEFDRRCMSGPAAKCYQASLPIIADAAYHESLYRNYEFDCKTGDPSRCADADKEEASTMALWNSVSLRLEACSRLE